MKSVVLDTSFIQSYLDKKDRLHKEARDTFSKLPDGTQFIIPIIVAAELIVGSEQLWKIYDFFNILSHNLEVSNSQDLGFVAAIDYKKRRSLKSNDCFVLAICERKEAELITFDKRLEKFAREIL